MEITTNNVPVKVEGSNGPERPAKKNGKEDKSRRKDDKSIEQVMKALNVLETTEEKLAAMCKKYTEIVDENRKLQLAAKQWEKGLHTVQREKEQLQADHSKAVLTRSRLESLCRELQRQNKQIKDESLLKVREEEEKRKEVSAKFNTTLAEITTLMSSSNEKTNMLRDENVEITKKFKSICDQSAIQQQQVDKMNTQRKLESELTEARLTKQRLEYTAEKEVLLKEKQEMFLDIHTLHARIKELEASETSLKGQVTLYADRYDEFQTALTKSNEVFGGFKGEMEKMSKKITRLEKETSTWKSRWEKSHQSFLEVVAEKAKCEGELSLANRKHAQLEKLCRTLQTERVLLLAQIKGLILSQSTDGSIETATAHIECMLASAGVQHTACSMGKVTAENLKLVSDESNSEKASESLDTETAVGNNLLHTHNSPQATNQAQAVIDNFDNVVGMMKTISVDGDLSVASPCPCGDSPKRQDDVNALPIDKTAAGHAENQGNKMGDDFHTVHKKGAKSRTGQSDTVKKTKPLSANDARKTGIDNSTEKKDSTRVVGVNKTRHDSTSEKKDKKHKGEVIGKSDIDSANEKKGLADVTDTNKLAESVDDEKKDDPTVQGSQLDTSLGVGGTNSSVNVDKKENIVDARLIKNSNIAEEKKANAHVNETSRPAKKPEFEKKVKVGGATNKMASEKKHVLDKNIDLVETTHQDVVDSSSKEDGGKLAEEKAVSAEANVQPTVGAAMIKAPEKESPNEENKVENKFGVLSYAKVSAKNLHVEKKVPEAVSTNTVSISPNKDDTVSTLELDTASKVVSEPHVPAKETDIEQVKDVRVTDKIPPAPSNDTKKPKTPEKPKRADKARVEGNKSAVDDKAVKDSVESSLPKLSDEGDKLDGLQAPEPKAVAPDPASQIPVPQAEAAEPGPSEVTNAQQCSEVKKEKVVAKKRKK